MYENSGELSIGFGKYTNIISCELETKVDLKEIAEHAVPVKLAYEELESICNNESININQFISVLNRGTVRHLASYIK